MTDYTPNMTETELYEAAYAMDRIGGGFASAVANAFFRADTCNRIRLLAAFGDLFEKFHRFNQGEQA